MAENKRLRFFIIIILVGAIVGVTLSMPLWIDQITGEPMPEEASKDPFYTPTSEFDNASLAEASSTPTNTLPPPKTGADNCVRGASYWLSHQDSWPFDEIRISDKNFSKAEAVLIIATETQDPSQLLLGQLFVYTLNVQYGADQRNVLDIVVEAHHWINAHPAGSVFSEQDQQWAYEMVGVLNEFNHGNLGPGICPEMTDTPAPTSTPSPTPTETPTVTPTATATPTAVVTLPPEFYTPIPEVRPKPDNTKVPGEPQPEPTEPPPEPTEPPPPVEPTQPPPPTAAPTEEELPTAAPTPES